MPRWHKVVALIAFFALSTALFAQRDLGTISGTVTDSSGGAVPKAKVILTDDSTGVANGVETNESGEFIRPLIKPGTYTVSVSAAGFKLACKKA